MRKKEQMKLRGEGWHVYAILMMGNTEPQSKAISDFQLDV